MEIAWKSFIEERKLILHRRYLTYEASFQFSISYIYPFINLISNLLSLWSASTSPNLLPSTLHPFIPRSPFAGPLSFIISDEKKDERRGDRHEPLEMAALETRGVAEMDDTRNRATPAREGEEEGEERSSPAAPSWTHLSCQRPKILRGNEHVGEDNGLGVWSRLDF